MASKHHRTYEDFEPPVERSEEDGCTILTLYIPGFSKEHIKVQVSSKGKLRVSGERPYRNSKHTWQRFYKEFEIPSNCDTANITAKYKGGILHVRQPLLDHSKLHTLDQQTPEQQAKDTLDKPNLEETKQTNSVANDNAPDTDAPNINNKPTIPKGRRLKEVIHGVFLNLVLPILLTAILLLFWYAKRLSPTVSARVGEPPQ
ncbi:inactive protein RESTRICTED TEV MOVEMENT 2-like [Benincasa hispida]|uniref:inactive protein RESTRICTED TEV MOVEMENT 2-like n=1 Tax=Benincasa hispida TaxID=102211 RepID=UPI0019021274|nr:inactive protein RESTRICTED TEV MOVEMENT 2-like [Benincasa hispida]